MQRKPPHSVLVADDHAVVRQGLVALIDGERDLRVVGQAENGEQAVAAAETLAPAIAVLDMRMPGLGGAPAVALMHERCPDVAILVLSMSEEASYVRAALTAGARGYVAKRSGAETLLAALRCVAVGERYLDPLLEDAATTAVAAGRLSVREAEVAQLIAVGHTGPAIAEQLGVSKSSIDTYRARIFNKLSVQSRAELVERLRDTDGTRQGEP